MLYRNYIGGVVFHKDKVFMIQNEKFEWILPRVRIDEFGHSKNIYVDLFWQYFKMEIALKEHIGDSVYEFYSVSREVPMCNTVIWYEAKTLEESFTLTKVKGRENAGFYGVKDALEKLTYTQEREILKESLKDKNSTDKAII